VTIGETTGLAGFRGACCVAWRLLDNGVRSCCSGLMSGPGVLVEHAARDDSCKWWGTENGAGQTEETLDLEPLFCTVNPLQQQRRAPGPISMANCTPCLQGS